MLGVMFRNRCFVSFFLAFCVQFLHFLVACLLDFQLERSPPVAPAIVFEIFMVENVPFFNEKPEVNRVIFVMFRGPMWLQIRTFVCFRDLRFEVLLLVLNRDRYFHLPWRRFGMSNPAKRGHAPPSGETPG